ncbi:MAG: membrane protein DedA with SNARE-associated domain [Verrucomicrobiales bacterium]
MCFCAGGAAKGTFSFPLAACGCLLGIVVSDVGLFLLGQLWGEKIIRYPPISWLVTPKRLELGKGLYKRYGGALVVISRFLPGTRMIAYIAAGMLGYSWKCFAVYMCVACAIWTPVVVGFAMFFGGAILSWLEAYKRWAILGFPLAVFVVWLALKGFFHLTEALHQKKSE